MCQEKMTARWGILTTVLGYNLLDTHFLCAGNLYNAMIILSYKKTPDAGLEPAPGSIQGPAGQRLTSYLA